MFFPVSEASSFGRPRKQLGPQLLCLALCTLASGYGCKSDDGPTLRVDLKTDFAPGTEFDAVRVRIGDGDVALITDRLVDEGVDYVRGARLAEGAVTAGQTPVTVTLVRAGETIITRRVLVGVSPPVTIATVVITRSCAGIECPNENPAFTSCLGGRCVDPRCTVETPEFCPPPVCTADSECIATAACAEALCQDDVCLSVPRDSSCRSGERCDAYDDCVPRVSLDAGATDASLDTSAPDAGASDTGADALDAELCFPGPSDGGPPDPGPPPPDGALYISPGGTDGGDGSRGNPLRTFSVALSRLSAGDTLVLLPGDYGASTGTGYLDIRCGASATACDGAPCPSGSSSSPITIMADDSRTAVIRMEAGQGMVPANVRLESCQGYVLDGLTLLGIDGDGWYLVAIESSTNITLRRSLIARNNRANNTHLVGINNSANVLIEDSEFYDFHRKAIAPWRSRNITVRRNYINPRGRVDIAGGYESGTPTSGDSGFSCQNSSRCIAENNIFIGSNNNIELRTATPIRDGAGLEGDGARIVGNIFIEGRYGVFATSACANMPSCNAIDERSISDLRLMDNVFLGQEANGIAVRGAEGVVVRNNSLFGANILINRATDNSSLACSADVFNNTLQTSGTSIFLEDQEVWTIDGNNTFPGRIVTDNETGLGTNGQIDPQLGGCLHRVPGASPLNGTGRDGEDLGARIVHRYVDGVLTDEPLWTAERSFPCGAIVAGINDGASDTCATFDALGIGAGCCLE